MLFHKRDSDWFIYKKMSASLPAMLYIQTGILLRVLPTMISAEVITRAGTSHDWFNS